MQKGTDIDNIRYPSSTFSAWVAFNDTNHDDYVTGSNPLNASYLYYGIMLFMKNAQIFIKYPENRAYSRVFANNSWSSWGDYAKTTELPPDFKLFRNFDRAEDTLVWTIQKGQPVMGLAVDNCCFGFRKNCPVDGQLSFCIDGRFYQNEGQNMCLDTQNYSDYAIPKSGGTFSGNIGGVAGGIFATDGNVYINSGEYKNWLTNYLGDLYANKAATNHTHSDLLDFKVYFEDTNASSLIDLFNKKTLSARSKLSSNGVFANYGGWSGHDFGLFIGQVVNRNVLGLYIVSDGLYKVWLSDGTTSCSYVKITTGNVVS